MIQRDATPSNRRTSFRQKLDIPIEVKIQGLLGEPNRQATLMDLSSTGCRIRSQITYDMGTRIGFELPTGGKNLKLTGAIVSREKSVSSFIFDYGITFANLSEAQKEAIVQQLMNFQRRDAVAVSFKKQSDTLKDVPQTRLTYREAVTFPVTFMHGQSVNSTGHATDISMDGIRLWCGSALQNGARVHLTFTLPEYVLYPDADPDEPAPRPAGKHPQGFKEMTARGVVVARLASNEKTIPHGVKFVDLHPVDREELARFIHLLQLYKLAKAKGQQTKRPAR